MENINLIDFAQTIDLCNTLIRLGLFPSVDTLDDMQAQFDLIKYRSVQTINDSHYGGKYESNKQR